MATADQIASPGTYMSKDIGLEVTDGTSVRVTLGVITSTTDATGAVVPTDYGIKIIAADGTTQIIDGVSDVFRIIASGNLTVAAAAAPSTVTATATYSAVVLGLPYAVTPAMHFTVSSATSERYIGSFYSMNASGTCDWAVIGSSSLVTGTLTITLTIRSILTNPGGTYTMQYYVLAQAGI